MTTATQTRPVTIEDLYYVPENGKAEIVNMETSFNHLEERLARLERRERILVGGILALLGILVLAVLRPVPVQSEEKGTTLKAPLKVVDEQGRLVLKVYRTASISGSTYSLVTVYDAKGQPAATLSERAGGGELELKNDGRFAILLTSGPESSVIGAFFPQTNDIGVRVGATTETGFVEIRDKKGKRIFYKPSKY